jgi:two-component system NtrC family sensor kinase
VVKISLKTKLIVAFAVVTLIPSVAATIVGVRLLGTRIVKQAQEKVAYDLNTARIIYHSRLNYVETVTRDSAIRFVTREALENKNAYIILDTLEKTRQERSLDMLGLVGSDGRILVRAQNPAMHGDSVKTDILIEKCLGTKKSISGSIIMCSERLLNEGVHLAERANIEIIPTPHTAPREGKVETSGMVLEACAPVFNDKGELLGAVYGGVLLNRNYDIVDEVKETAYRDLTYRGKEIGTATIFQGDLRISTNVHSSDGSRAIGTRVSEEVNQRVLRQGGTWTGPAFVVNNWYLSAYEPIKDVEDNVIGMLYVGILEEKFADLKRNTFLFFLATAAVGVAIALVVGWFLAAKISRPVARLARASRILSQGDFSVSVKRTSKDEIGELEETFNMMARSIWERDERLKEETRQKLTQSEKLAAIGRLAAGVAHQINNPLTTVLIRSELLLRKAQDEQKEDLEAVIKEANRCSRIVKGLLDFSRQSVPRKDAVGLNEILSEVVSLVKNQARINNVEILEDYAQNLPAVVVDQDQFREVFLNITLNALDAMPDGGVLLLSTYFTKKPEPRVCVTIEDSGIGIPKENVPKLFDPFFTTKEKGKGTGLGLAVSYGIVQAHNGTIEVESTVGKGTKCTVVLPTSARRMDGTARAIAIGGQGSESSKSENPGG